MSPRPDPPGRNRQNILNAAETPEQPHRDTADPVAGPVADDAAVIGGVEDGDVHEWRAVRDKRLAAMSTEDRRVYEMSATAADAGLDVAEWAYRARLAAGLSYAELAKAVESTVEAIERLEGGDPTLPLNLIAYVAHVTKVPLQLTVSARDADIDKPGPEEPHR